MPPQTFANGILVQGAAVITDAAGTESRIRLDGASGEVVVGIGGGTGMIRVQDTNGVDVAWIMGNGDVILNGDLYTGPLSGPGERTFRVRQRGDISLNYTANTGETYTVFQLNPEDAGTLRTTMRLGGGDGAHGRGGDLRVMDFTGTTSIRLDGGSATAVLGNRGHSATLVLSNSRNQEAIRLEANRGTMAIRDETDHDVIRLESGNAVVIAGGNGKNGNIVVDNAAGKHVISLNGASGDIIMRNADAAEQFPVASGVDAEPGTVMVLLEHGQVGPSSQSYDHRVVGVVAGAGEHRPGIILDHRDDSGDLRVPVSVMGKVACRADARYGAIAIGDMLTTSPTRGCAMKATDWTRAWGAVVGKALTPLDDGVGLVNLLAGLR